MSFLGFAALPFAPCRLTPQMDGIIVAGAARIVGGPGAEPRSEPFGCSSSGGENALLEKKKLHPVVRC